MTSLAKRVAATLLTVSTLTVFPWNVSLTFDHTAADGSRTTAKMAIIRSWPNVASSATRLTDPAEFSCGAQTMVREFGGVSLVLRRDI